MHSITQSLGAAMLASPLPSRAAGLVTRLQPSRASPQRPRHGPSGLSAFPGSAQFSVSSLFPGAICCFPPDQLCWLTTSSPASSGASAGKMVYRTTTPPAPT